MKSRKSLVGIPVLFLVAFSLALAACGDTTATTAPANSAATTPTTGPVTTSAAITTSVATTAPATTSTTTTPATTTEAVTTPTATTPAANSKKPDAANRVAPEMIVNRLYTDLKSGDLKKNDTALLSSSLKSLLNGSKGDKKAGTNMLDKLVGLNSGQKIDSFTVDKPVITGDSASVTATLKLSDGSSVKNSLSLVKSQVKDKQGDERTLWQVDKISVVN